ncbi:MAG: ABC transporter permease, partial [Chloroflexi bacterium]|nr:ABC transporter permease [Chloroflexota bacterium]
MTRSQMLEVLREDYIRTARAKGLLERNVVLRHALKNMLLPVVTLSGIQLGFLLGGTVIMESIFVLPGMGRNLVDSILHRDYPMTQGIVLLMALTYTTINLVVDVLYAWLDPRINYH